MKTIKKQTKKALPTMESELKKAIAKKETKPATKKVVKVKSEEKAPEIQNIYHVCYVDKNNKFRDTQINVPFKTDSIINVWALGQSIKKITNGNFSCVVNYKFVCEMTEEQLKDLESAKKISRSDV